MNDRPMRWRVLREGFCSWVFPTRAIAVRYIRSDWAIDPQFPVWSYLYKGRLGDDLKLVAVYENGRRTR